MTVNGTGPGSGPTNPTKPIFKDPRVWVGSGPQAVAWGMFLQAVDGAYRADPSAGNFVSYRTVLLIQMTIGLVGAIVSYWVFIQGSKCVMTEKRSTTLQSCLLVLILAGAVVCLLCQRVEAQGPRPHRQYTCFGFRLGGRIGLAPPPAGPRIPDYWLRELLRQQGDLLRQLIADRGPARPQMLIITIPGPGGQPIVNIPAPGPPQGQIPAPGPPQGQIPAPGPPQGQIPAPGPPQGQIPGPEGNNPPPGPSPPAGIGESSRWRSPGGYHTFTQWRRYGRTIRSTALYR